MTDAEVPAPAPALVPSRRARGLSWRARCAVAVCAAALVAVPTMAHLWFIPFLVGIALGLLTKWRRDDTATALSLVALATLGGWSAPLLVRALAGEKVLDTAGVVAALAGLPRSGWIIVAVTLLIALVQGLLGVWLGRAALGLKSPK